MTRTLTENARRSWLKRVASWCVQTTILTVPLSWFAWRNWRESDRYHGGIGCREMLGILAAYEEGRLAGERAVQVRVHLARCGGCWRLRKYRETHPAQTVLAPKTKW